LKRITVKTLITGSTGKLGRELKRILLDALTPTHNELDIRNKTNVNEYLKINMPNSVIHCAALTGIKQCEENKQLAYETNVVGTENLVKSCLEHVPDCYFVYVSTACVFYGDRGNYTENDLPYPKNYYSFTKTLGEFVVRESPIKRWLIVRTNFVERTKWMYEKAFTDRFGTYLFADDVAAAINDVMAHGLTGTVHICGEEKLSMFDLAKLTTPEIKPMTISDYNGPPLTMDMSLRSIRIPPYRISR
jgi:dTDP-4-dehydrorhamnose reductase